MKLKTGLYIVATIAKSWAIGFLVSSFRFPVSGFRFPVIARNAKIVEIELKYHSAIVNLVAKISI